MRACEEELADEEIVAAYLDASHLHRFWHNKIEITRDDARAALARLTVQRDSALRYRDIVLPDLLHGG